MSRHVCGTIEYMTEGGPTHSDICFDGKPSGEEREFLHACLDEWLDKRSGVEDELFSLGDHRLLYPDKWDVDHAVSMILKNIEDCGLDLSERVREDIEFYVRDGIKRLLS